MGALTPVLVVLVKIGKLMNLASIISMVSKVWGMRGRGIYGSFLANSWQDLPSGINIMSMKTA